MPKQVRDYTIGHKFGRPDVERLGVFVDDVDFSTKFSDPLIYRHKGHTFLTECLKNKDGSQGCYIDRSEFKRLFIGEALEGKAKRPKKIPNISEKPFVRPDGEKLHSTPGDYYGTFAKKEDIKSFSAQVRPEKKSLGEGRNFVTNRAKLGGPGYVDITIAPYPKYEKPSGKVQKPRIYGNVLNGPLYLNIHGKGYFDPNPFKDPPNIKPGPYYSRPKDTVEKNYGPWTPIGPNKLEAKEYFSVCKPPSKDPYLSPMDADFIYQKKMKKPNLAGPYCPQSTAFKTKFTDSIVNHNAYKIHVNNYMTAEPNYIKRLVC